MAEQSDSSSAAPDPKNYLGIQIISSIYMKAFLFDSLNRFRKYSEELDTKAEIRKCLCDKAWQVFNNSGDKEVYIFQEDGSLIISINGNITRGSWQYLSVNNSIAISASNQEYMVHPAFLDNILFALQVDGTENYAFLIDQKNAQNFAPKSLDDLHSYFRLKEQKRIEEENRIREEQRLAELKRIEEERMRKESEGREKKMERLVEEIYKNEISLSFLEWLNNHEVLYTVIIVLFCMMTICLSFYLTVESGVALMVGLITAVASLSFAYSIPVLILNYRFKKFIKNNRTYNTDILSRLVEYHNKRL